MLGGQRRIQIRVGRESCRARAAQSVNLVKAEVDGRIAWGQQRKKRAKEVPCFLATWPESVAVSRAGESWRISQCEGHRGVSFQRVTFGSFSGPTWRCPEGSGYSGLEFGDRCELEPG